MLYQLSYFRNVVPRTGLEPACLSTHAPETCASTNSATWALTNQKPAVKKNGEEQITDVLVERKTRLELATLTLAKVMLYQLSYFRKTTLIRNVKRRRLELPRQ